MSDELGTCDLYSTPHKKGAIGGNFCHNWKPLAKPSSPAAVPPKPCTHEGHSGHPADQDIRMCDLCGARSVDGGKTWMTLQEYQNKWCASPAAVPAQPELGKCGWLEGMPRPSHPNGIPHARRDDCAVWQSVSDAAQPDAVEREQLENEWIAQDGILDYRNWLQAALVKERRERKRLEEAAVIFKTTRGAHFGTCSFTHQGCEFCNQSYVDAESMLDLAFGIQHDTQVEAAIKRLGMDRGGTQ